MSIKSKNEDRELNEDKMCENDAGHSSKFIIIWLKENLMTGALCNEINIVVNNICGFNS